MAEVVIKAARGGGLKMGQVIGQSARDAGEQSSEPIGIENLMARIFDTLLRVSDVRLLPNLPNDVSRVLTGSTPIPGLS